MYLINQQNMRVQHNKSQDKQNFPFWAPEMAAKFLEFADRCGVLLLLSNLFGTDCYGGNTEVLLTSRKRILLIMWGFH